MSLQSIYPPSGSGNITTDPPLDFSGGVLSIPEANGSTNGYLSSADWNTFSTAAGGGISGLSGDVTTGAAVGGIAPATVVKINGTTMSSLATGILKNTTGTGVPSIAVAADFPTLNQNTTGTAASATNFTGNLLGDVTGTQGATVVGTVGGSSAANVNAATLLANAATNANTASTIVRRDASGNFTASSVTLSGLTVNGTIGATGSLSASSLVATSGNIVANTGNITATDGVLTAGAATNQLAIGSTFKTTFNSAVTANRLVTLPDANSVTVVPKSAVSNQFLTNIGSDGTQTGAQPSFSNISGDLDLTTQVTGILPVANGGTNLSALGSGNQLLAMNVAGTSLAYKTLESSGGTVTIGFTDTTIDLSVSGGGGGAIPSITGTSNQVLVNNTFGSPQTGAITLTLPPNVSTTKLALGGTTFTNTLDVIGNAAIGYTAGNAAATNGLSVKGILNVGSSTSNLTNGQVIIGGFAPVNIPSLFMIPILSNNSNTVQCYSIYHNPSITNGANGSTHYGIWSSPTFQNTSFSSVTNIGHFFESTASGTTTNLITGYFAAPDGGTNQNTVVIEQPVGGSFNVALSVVGNMSVGYASTIIPPTNGLLVAGKTGWNINTPDSTTFNNFNSTTGQSAATNSYYTGTLDSFLFSSQATTWFTATHSAGSSANILSSILSNEVFSTSGGTTTSVAAGFYNNNRYSGNAGTITTAAGVYIDPNSAGAGTITTAFGGFFGQPVAGTQNYSLKFDGGLVGKRRAVSGSTTATTADYILAYTSTAGAYTVTLPSAAPQTGWILIVKDESNAAGTNNITINGNGRNIDGAGTKVINSNGGAFSIYFNGSNYFTF